MMQPLDPLSQALADAVALYRHSRADGAALEALRAAADECAVHSCVRCRMRRSRMPLRRCSN